MSPSPNDTQPRSPAQLAAIAITAVAAVSLAACTPSDLDPGDQEVEPTPGTEPAEGTGEAAASTSPPHVEHEMPGGLTGEHPRDREDEVPDREAEESRDESEPAETGEDPAEEPTPAPLEGRLIALDPGHNGANFDTPDEIAREVDDGVGPCIDERGAFGQDVGADLMISIHADGASEDAHGFH